MSVLFFQSTNSFCSEVSFTWPYSSIKINNWNYKSININKNLYEIHDLSLCLIFSRQNFYLMMFSVIFVECSITKHVLKTC